MTFDNQLQGHLNFIYGPETAGPVLARLTTRLAEFARHYPAADPPPPAQRVTQADSILITYGDQMQEPGKPALQSLAEFLEARLKGVISSVHLLPFYPYTSDDGFSVVDYTAVDPALGNWPDLIPLRRNFRLMFDAVINHVSAHSQWFQGFLQGQARYADYFITVPPNTDLSSITRPRTLPLLTPVNTPTGEKHVWTTFSADQIDLNFKNPAVLLEIVDVLLFYVAQGAEFIRLDAIAYLWKEIGTSSIHLPQTHRVVQLFRTVLDRVAPHVLLITETNVPHAENISYFGNGRNEAQLVYNFSLAPLILHTLHTGNAGALQHWAAGLEKLPETAAFFNFIASHDGLGVRPAEGILSPVEIQHLADKTAAHGGQVSYKTNPNGSQSAYELNITLFDALSDPQSDESERLKIDRFMASQAIMLALAGVPGIYAHSLVGSSNNYEGFKETGRARTLNREKWQRARLEANLAAPGSRAAQVFGRYVDLLKVRASTPAFHPNGAQQIVPGNSGVFALLRTSSEGSHKVLCVHNISARPQLFEAEAAALGFTGPLVDMLSGQPAPRAGGALRLNLAPYQAAWLAQNKP
jgi:sucrose phosphorylase